ncbi:MAG TPA: DUF2279 domain-containing protein [Thermoanaerobaculia bacterium]
MKKSTRRPFRGVLILCLSAATASAESFQHFGKAAPDGGVEASLAEVLRPAGEAEGGLGGTEPPACFERDCLAASVAEAQKPELFGSATVGAPEPKPPKTAWIVVVTAATFLGSAYNSFTDGPNQKFHFTNEGFFGQNTYAGGADKASHFVSYFIVAKLLSGVYEELGMPTDRARVAGAIVSTFAGFITELGDGRGKYGFSYEDLVFDTLGAATQLAIAHYGLGDLVGFSAGLIPAPPKVCCPYGGFGMDYSEVIYSGNLKLAGLGARTRLDPGPARFLLLSLTYSSKGYPFSNPDVRERQIGMFVGINFVEILRAAGVSDQTLWGKTLYFLFDVIRIPYTQIGYQYDVNHRRWHGPTIGDAFPGGAP